MTGKNSLEDTIQKSLVQGRLLAASIVTVVGVLAAARGYDFDLGMQEQTVDAIMAILSSIGAGVIVGSKIRSMLRSKIE